MVKVNVGPDDVIGARKVDVVVDVGHPLGNRVVDSFLKLGAVGVCHSAAQETYNLANLEKVDQRSIEQSLTNVGQSAVKWGAISAVYQGSQYAMEKARGKRDWTGALAGGALAGIALSVLSKGDFHQDDIIQKALTGGAVAAAFELSKDY